MSETFQKTLLKIKTVAERWDCSPRTIKRYLENKDLEYVLMPGGEKRILLSSVEKYEKING